MTEQPTALQGAPELEWKYMSYDGDNWIASVDGKNTYHITSWKEGSFFCDHDSKNDHTTLEAAKAWCQQHYEDTLRKNDPWKATPPTEPGHYWLWDCTITQNPHPVSYTQIELEALGAMSLTRPKRFRWMPAQLPPPPMF